MALMAAVVTLSACTSPASTPNRPASGGGIQKYEAATGSTARLVLRGFVPPGDVYVISVFDDAEACARRRIVGSGNAIQHPDTTTLAAGPQVTLEFHFMTAPTSTPTSGSGSGSASSKSCLSRWTFTPRAGSSYMLTGIGTATGCLALISDIGDVEHIKPEPTALHRNPGGLATCLPVAQSKPFPASASAGASAAPTGIAVLRDGATSADLQGLIAP